MMHEELVVENSQLDWRHRHRFLLMVAIAILISFFLVGVALAMYASSGTAQLDLSRPGYTSVRDQAARPDTSSSFPEDGPINKNSLDQFRKLYDQQANQITSVDSFGGTVMSDQSLSIDAPASDTGN